MSAAANVPENCTLPCYEGIARTRALPQIALQKRKFGFISTQPGSSLTLQVNTTGAPVSGGQPARSSIAPQHAPSTCML